MAKSVATAGQLGDFAVNEGLGWGIGTAPHRTSGGKCRRRGELRGSLPGSHFAMLDVVVPSTSYQSGGLGVSIIRIQLL